ncbi:MAG: DUF559 domain-containing protein [Cetobacterium sp.]|uniref:DUF559 domain-containing protein n=1 Tax=Cetobacterium sp. TaxID=2071632 RepID=UPI003EE605CA
MTITYTINNQTFTSEPNEDGFYNATECWKNCGNNNTICDFTKSNNKQWEGQYISKKGRYGGTLGTKTFTIAMLRYLEVSSVMVDGVEHHVTKATRIEHDYLSVIEQVIERKLVRQFKVGPYRIDGYDAEGNVAYEIDEPQHDYQVDADAEREQFITSILGCKFKRIKI